MKTLRLFPGFLVMALLSATMAGAQPPIAPGAMGVSQNGTFDKMTGDQLVANVVVQLDRRDSIAARVLLQASLGGRQLLMGGADFPSKYYQQWDANREKLLVWCDLQGHVEGTPIHLRQVSDGDRLWTDRKTPAGRKVTRVDLRRIRRDLEDFADGNEQLPAGEAGVLPIQIELLSERGGLPSMMAALSENFVFSPPVSLSLAKVPVAGTIGTWKPARLSAIYPPVAVDRPPTGGQANEESQLPPRLPASVMLLVGQDDLFPYVIEFRSSQATEPLVPGDLSLYQMRPQPLLLVHFYERSFRMELDANNFEYSPGETEWTDLTAARLERLHQTRRPAAAQQPSTDPPR
jgi:hypothetical protein